VNVLRKKSQPWKVYGNSDAGVFITGHSHTFSLYAKLIQSDFFSSKFGLISHSNFKSPKQVNLDYWKFVVANTKEKVVTIFWNGNQHNIHFLLETKESFNIFQIYQQDEYSPVISQERLTQLFKPTFDELRKVIELFPNPNNLKFVQTPAPKSKKFIDSKISSDDFFLNLAKQNNFDPAKIESTTDKLRVSLWEFNNQILGNLASEYAIDVIAVPSESRNEIGLLKEKFYTEDLTHANELYGELVLNQLVQEFNLTNV